jgi:hypothetical protein
VLRKNYGNIVTGTLQGVKRAATLAPVWRGRAKEAEKMTEGSNFSGPICCPTSRLGRIKPPGHPIPAS